MNGHIARNNSLRLNLIGPAPVLCLAGLLLSLLLSGFIGVAAAGVASA